MELLLHVRGQQVIIFHPSLPHSLPIVPIFYHVNANLPLLRLSEACLAVSLLLVSYLGVFNPYCLGFL